MSSETPFNFDQKQRNTLRASGLAAYVQRPPKDRVGWVHVRQVWLPGWRPDKWAYEVQHLEVTWDSYRAAEQYEAENLDFEPWNVLMLTAHDEFLTDNLSNVEQYFALFTDQPAYVQHPDRVNCPHEPQTAELTRFTFARYSLTRRSWVALLLRLRDEGTQLHWDAPGKPMVGTVTAVGFDNFTLSTLTGDHSLRFSDRSGAQLYRTEADGHVHRLWHEPTERTGLIAEDLPLWNRESGQWERPAPT